ncbi:MAG: heme-dependent peroxidase, partial [Terracidiphilus sp.]
MAEFPPVPLTLEGSALLHQFFRFDWKAWRGCADGERSNIAAEFTSTLKKLEQGSGSGAQTGLFSQLGHKGDLILVHFRESFDALNQVELDLAQT